MQGRKRFLAALLCLCALLMILPQNALAAETGESVYRVVIDDEADLLTEEDEAALRAVMENVLPYGNAAFVSVDSNPTTTERLAESKFLEFFGDVSGALLIIDMDNRYIQLIADGEIYKTVNRKRCNEITDNIYTYASKGDYRTCAIKAFEQVVRVLGGQRVAAPFRYVTNAFLAICLALLGNFALMSLQRRKKVSPEDALKVKVDVCTAKPIGTAARTAVVAGVVTKMLSQRKTKHVESSGGGGRSGGGGGGHSGGGGGFSGGGGGHRF